MKRKFSASNCVAVAVALMATMSACSGGDQQQQAQAPTLKVLTVEEVSATLQQTYPAQIKGKTDIEIRPQVSGFITKVCVDEGQQVRKGQVLFTIDQVQFQAAVDQAQAAVNTARTNVANAQITEANQRALYQRNIISQNAWQTSENQLRAAQAQLAQAEAALTSARKNLSYCQVVAPCDGVVGSIPNREGSLASPSSAVPLTTVSDNSQVYAYFSFTEKDMLEMTNNGTTSLDAAVRALPEVSLLLADGAEYGLKGKVATVSGVIDSSTGSSTVRALFDNPSGMLRSGNTGKVAIPVTVDHAILVPQNATFEVQSFRYVFCLNDSNVTVNTRIEVLPLNDGKNFVVTSGLKAGDRVVVEGVGTSVRAGMTVNPAPAAEAQAQEQPAEQQ